MQDREALHDALDADRQIGRAGQRSAAEFEVMKHAELREDVAALWDVDHACIEHLAGREIRRITPREADLAGADREQSEDGLEHRRFAGPVRTDHRRYAAAADARAGSVENGHLAVAGGDA